MMKYQILVMVQGQLIDQVGKRFETVKDFETEEEIPRELLPDILIQQMRESGDQRCHVLIAEQDDGKWAWVAWQYPHPGVTD